MKRFLIRLITGCSCLIAISIFATSAIAQGNGNGKGNGGGNNGGGDPPSSPFQYRVEYGYLPIGATGLSLLNMQETNAGIVAVGAYYLYGERRGFVYDHQNDAFTDIHDLFQLPMIHSSSCRSINANGIVVGNTRDLDGNQRSYWFDYTALSPTLNYLDDQFTDLVGLYRPNAADINIHGDIVVDDQSIGGSFCVNPFANSSYQLPLLKPLAISDSGFVLSDEGYDGALNTYSVARWSQSFGKETFTLKMNDIGAINELGEFGALIDDGPLARGTPCRVGNQIDWIASTSDAYWVSSINDTRDIGYMEVVTTGKGKNRISLEKAFLYHESQDQVFSIDSLVADSFLNSGQQLVFFLTNRDMSLSMPTPAIVGSVNDGQGDYRIYFLIPEEP